MRLSGLDPAARYAVLLEFQPLQAHRWRFVNGEWTAGSSSSSSSSSSSGASEATVDGYAHVHPSSPATGEKWMRDCVTFAKLKISNKENGNRKVLNGNRHLSLPNTCHCNKYQLVLYTHRGRKNENVGLDLSFVLAAEVGVVAPLPAMCVCRETAIGC